MKNRESFHKFIIYFVASLFVLPVFTFSVMLLVNLNTRISFILSIGMFIFMLFYISLRVVHVYDSKHTKFKKE